MGQHLNNQCFQGNELRVHTWFGFIANVRLLTNL